MKARATILASLVLVCLLAAPTAAVASPRGAQPIVGPCRVHGGSSFNIVFFPDLASRFPGASALGFDFKTNGSAIAVDNVAASARVQVSLRFFAKDEVNQINLWQATALIPVQGVAPEEPPPNVDAAFFPMNLNVKMVPLGFSAPTVRLSWPVTLIIVWIGGSIGCTVYGDIPTLV